MTYTHKSVKMEYTTINNKDKIYIKNTQKCTFVIHWLQTAKNKQNILRYINENA